ncbi:MAG: hypothetical protein CVU47_12500 [Chloroflexi bacterium HGW-Chloroflexi-9]|nr:MAG: hypothetical protein CVU47_12500 [Chloroflexi bacterium HGW-Chloroflexi-9]
MAGDQKCLVVLMRGGHGVEWRFCDAPVVDASAKGRSLNPERYLCTAHFDLAYEAGIRFARIGYIHHSRFAQVSLEGYAGRLLMEAFGRDVAVEASGLVDEGSR